MTNIPTEIERKFLVRIDKIPPRLFATASVIRQGYLANVNHITCRVRTVQGSDGVNSGYITYKGSSSEGGISRNEVEMEIPFVDATVLLSVCEGVLTKRRVEHVYKKQLFEIDMFEGRNSGLVIAEIELEHEDQGIALPNYCASEVTGDTRYYNSSLISNPYMNWGG